MPAAEHERYGRLGHARDQLRDRKAGFHIAADRVEQHQHTVDLLGLLDRGDLRDQMLVFGGLVLRGQLHMALDLADDRDAVHRAARGFRGDRAGLGNVIFFGRPDGRIFLVHAVPPFRTKNTGY